MAGRGAIPSGVAMMARCISRAGLAITRCTMPLSKPAKRPVIRSLTIIMATSKRALARWSKLCGGGRRWSAANAYLRPALQRPNCSLIRAFARRVVIEQGRAVGVEVARGGKVEVIRANREVILSASSLNSPKLLMLSGIGPAAHLAEHGIDVVADRAGVGQNLQDHLE